MKLQIKNWWEHALVGVLVGLAGVGIRYIVNLIPNPQFEIGWFWLAILAFLAIRWEIGQENQSSLSTCEYLKLKWPDTIADLLAGNVPVWALCVIGMYGHSVIGVMR